MILLNVWKGLLFYENLWILTPKASIWALAFHKKFCNSNNRQDYSLHITHCTWEISSLKVECFVTDRVLNYCFAVSLVIG